MEVTRASATTRSGSLTAEDLCRLHAPEVCRFAAMMAASAADADDLAQDSLLRAVRGLAKFDPSRGSLDSWLWRIVVNAAKDSARRRQRGHDLLLRVGLFAPREVESVEDAVLTRLRDAELHAQLRLLPYRDRMLLALRYGGGLRTEEVGAAVGLNPDSAGKAIRRSLARLRARLEVTLR